jgi:VTC domain
VTRAASSELAEALDQLPGVSLSELDERAALLRRVDDKYAVDRASLLEIVRTLSEHHEALEIDGRREFTYCTTYFDTPRLRCFVEHVEGWLPRFKVRTRVYADSGQCTFEVKLKRGDGETDKRQLDYCANDNERLTAPARKCVSDALGDAGIPLPDELNPRLRTTFTRITLAPRDGSERLTCDRDVRLAALEGRAVELRRDLVLVECKSETGDSPADRALVGAGAEPVSLSKYRVGMSRVSPTPPSGPQPGSELFV